ncbi:hypothetical protein BV22DRAFT_872427 [Leucogyrophana mollusca]|uniref:Uncharacterized protein n=1 Tax=Leucogyrophana mollusca TaxID=85980 RepID=A0ACB8B0A3_9AGAM|nr:hypothetical protein BV22DRAFT_872427 [Leucogyrophana mollusca]
MMLLKYLLSTVTKALLSGPSNEHCDGITWPSRISPYSESPPQRSQVFNHLRLIDKPKLSEILRRGPEVPDSFDSEPALDTSPPSSETEPQLTPRAGPSRNSTPKPAKPSRKRRRGVADHDQGEDLQSVSQNDQSQS